MTADQFLDGYRVGFPVKGDPEVITPGQITEDYQRGLEIGQRDYQEHQDYRTQADAFKQVLSYVERYRQ